MSVARRASPLSLAFGFWLPSCRARVRLVQPLFRPTRLYPLRLPVAQNAQRTKAPSPLSCSPNCAGRMKFLPHRRDAGGINSRIVDGRLAAALEILHRALVFLRRCSRGERAQIPSPASPRFDLAGVKPVLARLELPDHPGPPRPCRSASITKKSSVTDSKWKQICPSKIRATGCFQRVRP